MTLRERWLAVGLTLSLALLGWLFLWQHARFEDAQQAVNRYVGLEDRAEGGEPALLVRTRQARVEARQSLRRGEFDRALRRLTAFEEETRDLDRVDLVGGGLPVDALWPPKSAERERARTALRTLAQKQAQGFDLRPAHEALLRMAAAARKGDRPAALAAFGEVEQQIRAANLRPGFRLPEKAVSTAPLPPDPEAQAKVAQLAQSLDQIMAQLPPNLPEEQQAQLGPYLGLAREFSAAYRGGKDLRAVVPLFGEMDKARKSGDQRTAFRLVRRVRLLIRQAPPLQGGPAAAAAVPGPQAQPGKPGSPAVPPAVAGKSPAGSPGAVSPQQIVQMLDAVRAMPADQYARSRPELVAYLDRMLKQTLASRPELMARRARLGVGDSLQLSLLPDGDIHSLRSSETNLSAGARPGGFTLSTGTGQGLALRGQVGKDGRSLVHRVQGAQGSFEARYMEEEDGLRVRVRTRRTQDGPPANVVMALPLRAAGWRWTTGSGEPQLMAADGKYEATGAVTLTAPKARLKLTLPPGATAVCIPAEDRLEIRLPLPAEKGASEHALRIGLEE